jgi:hydroxypyruvate isomerase
MIRERPGAPLLRLSAHLGYLFAELELEDRFRAARDAGFGAIEHPDPYVLPSSAFRSLCDVNVLSVAQIALPVGKGGGAEKGLAALPGREAEQEAALRAALAYARAVGCPMIQPMSGMVAPGQEARAWDVYLSNLRRTCSLAAEEGLDVIVEPISAQIVPGYFMSSPARAIAAIEAVGAANLHLSLDAYHFTLEGVDPAAFVRENRVGIAHVQIADWPGRHEPGSGRIDFRALFEALVETGYAGFIGLEYVPASTAADGLGWTRLFADRIEPLQPAARRA